MSLHRFLALCAASVLCAAANSTLAEQVSGQLQISLTILKRCELATRSDAAAVHLSERGCEHAAYQVRDTDGHTVPLTHTAETSSVAVQSVEDAGSTLVIYW